MDTVILYTQENFGKHLSRDIPQGGLKDLIFWVPDIFLSYFLYCHIL